MHPASGPYPPSGPHDRQCLRVPQRLRRGRYGYAGTEPRDEHRVCPLRPDKCLFPGEGPHAKEWLIYRGDTVRLLGYSYYLSAGCELFEVAAHDDDQFERVRCGQHGRERFVA